MLLYILCKLIFPIKIWFLTSKTMKYPLARQNFIRNRREQCAEVLNSKCNYFLFEKQSSYNINNARGWLLKHFLPFQGILSPTLRPRHPLKPWSDKFRHSNAFRKAVRTKHLPSLHSTCFLGVTQHQGFKAIAQSPQKIHVSIWKISYQQDWASIISTSYFLNKQIKPSKPF